ncbi:MAG TPA: phenylacetate--CoA ligase family protein, partial [Oceanithermus profundus]|nr:phenylacetate--CoA ligase family protein [Oceanithermus profundus]
DALVLRVKAAAVPEGLADAVRRATGLRVDRIEAAGEIEGGLVVDRRFG